jgi:hypothetical protein
MIFAALIAITAACTNDQPDQNDDPQFSCERIEVDQAEYCIYEQPITETGYDCPPDLMNPIPFGGQTVCSATEEIPDDHQRPLREHIDDQQGPLDGGRDADIADAEGCGSLICDALYIPLVSFSFSQPNGDSFCGDLEISYWGEGEEDSPQTKTCTCAQIQLNGVDDCHINPPIGKISYISVEATEAAYGDYAVFETSVDLPCQCHPQDHIDVEFSAAELTCENVEDQWSQFVADNNQCETDDDCTIISDWSSCGCTPTLTGSGEGLNKDASAGAQDYLDLFHSEACADIRQSEACDAAPSDSVSCDNGTCVANSPSCLPGPDAGDGG